MIKRSTSAETVSNRGGGMLDLKSVLILFLVVVGRPNGGSSDVVGDVVNVDIDDHSSYVDLEAASDSASM